MSLRRFAWLALSLSLVACKDEDSQKLETNEIDVSYYVSYEGEGEGKIHLQAHPYRRKSLQGVDLNDGDRIEVATTAMATPLVLKRGPAGGYFGDLPAGDHREVTFALLRSEKTSAPASKVKVMPRISFETPPEGATVSYAGEGLALRWTNATPGAQLILKHAQPCDTFSASATNGEGEEDPRWDDAGSLTIAPTQLSPAAPPAGGVCIRVALERALPGTVDPALGSGSVAKAYEDLFFDVTLVP